MKLKKKQLRIMLLMLLSLFAYNTWIADNSNKTLSNEDFIRFHVVANSNSSADQALKLKVRDHLLDVINDGLAKETIAAADCDKQNVSLDIEKTKEYIKENLNEIENAAEEIILAEGYQYPVEAELGVTWIPKKTYGNATFPAGNYQALNVTIGEGKGENWWCVLFPPLCLIGMEESDKNAEMEDLYRDALLGEKYRVLTESPDQPKTLQLKFKTLEMLKDNAK